MTAGPGGAFWTFPPGDHYTAHRQSRPRPSRPAGRGTSRRPSTGASRVPAGGPAPAPAGFQPAAQHRHQPGDQTVIAPRLSRADLQAATGKRSFVYGGGNGRSAASTIDRLGRRVETGRG